MADNRKYVQSQEFRLAVGANTSATSIRVREFVDIDGTVLTMTDFGDKGYGTLEPNTSREEQVVFTGVTDNGDNTYTLTGVSNVLAQAPYTETSGTTKTHASNAVFIISNNPGLYDSFANKKNEETIEEVWTFNSNADSANPIVDDSTYVQTADAELIHKKYADDKFVDTAGDTMTGELDMGSNKIVNLADGTAAQDAVSLAQLTGSIAGAPPNASETVKGVVEQATEAEFDAGTATGATGASLFATPAQIQDRGATLGFTALEDLTDGDPVAIATGTADNVVKAVQAAKAAGVTVPSNLDGAVIQGVIEISTDKFIVLYRYVPANYRLEAVVCTLDTDTMTATFGTELTMTAGGESTENGICKLDTDKFVVVFTNDGDNQPRYIICTVSGTVITSAGTGILTGSSGPEYSRANCCQLDTDKFAFFYHEEAGAGAPNEFYGFCTVSGGTPTVVDSSISLITSFTSMDTTAMTKIATDKFVIINGDDGDAVVCTTASSTLAVGTVVDTSSTTGDTTGGIYTSVISITDDTFFARFFEFIVYATVSGTVITVQDDEPLANDGAGDLFQDGTDVLEMFNATSGNTSGIYKIEYTGGAIVRTPVYGTFQLGDVTYGIKGDYESVGDKYFLFGGAETSADPKYHITGMSPSFIGFAQSTVSAGATVRVNPTSDDAQSGLNPGSIYKVNDGGLEVTIDQTEPYKVQAQSSTEVVVI